MLTRIDVDSENAFFVPILGVTPKDSLLIRKVTGLNPPDVDLFIGDYSRDGGIYQGRRVGNRNVVITMDLNPNPALGETVAGLRDMLYKAFVDPQVEADYIKLNLHDDNGRSLYLVGYTEKFETEIFDVETLAQISIICPDPYIRDMAETVLSHATGWTSINFNYTGTAETGFEARIHLTTNAPGLILTNNSVTDVTTDPNYNRGRMIFTRSFSNGDVVRICTVRGRRKATVQPGGTGPEISIVGNLNVNSPWMELHSQSNMMRVYGTNPSNIIAQIREVRYTQAYWGV